MQEITIAEIENAENEGNLGFHFCKTEDLYPNPNVRSKLNPDESSKGILIEGLIADNKGYLSSASKDEQPAVFFSLGFKGALGYINRILTNLSRFDLLIERNPEYVEKFFHKEKRRGKPRLFVTFYSVLEPPNRLEKNWPTFPKNAWTFCPNVEIDSETLLTVPAAFRAFLIVS